MTVARNHKRLGWVALSVFTATLLLAACAPASPPPPTLPPGSVDLTRAPFYRWAVGEQVDLKLGVIGLGANVTFAVTDGALPLGIELQPSGRLIGFPQRSGYWRLDVSATGSKASKSGVITGYVVEPGDISSAPMLADNPLRASFILGGGYGDGSHRTYALYRPGSTSPEAAPVLGDGAGLPMDPEEQTIPEVLWQLFGLGRTSLLISEADPGCVAELRDFRGKLIRTIVLDPDQICVGPRPLLSKDESTFVVSFLGGSGDGTWANRHWFIDSHDGEILREATSVGSGEDPRPILSQNGALLGIDGAVPNQLQVIGVAPEDDKLISYDDNSNRLCSASRIGFSSTSKIGTALLSCETAGISFQAGTINLDSGEVWLSTPIPDDDRIFIFRQFVPLALSPAGDQIVAMWGEAELIEPFSFWNPTYRTNFSELALINVDDSDQTLHKIVDTTFPSDFLFLFIDN